MADTEVAEREAPQEDAAEIEFTERMARRYGWRPETEWKGDKSKWTDAQKFMDGKLSGLDQLPRLRAQANQVERMAGKLAAIESQLSQAQKTKLTERMDAAMEANDREAARKILEEAEKSAGAGGTDDAVIADTKLGKEVSDRWLEDNDWFGNHTKATKYARELFAEMSAEKGDSRWSRDTYEEKHAEVERRVKAKYPSVASAGDEEAEEIAPKTARKDPPAVGRGARGGARATDGQLTPATMSLDQQRAAKETFRVPAGMTDTQRDEAYKRHVAAYCSNWNESRA